MSGAGLGGILFDKDGTLFDFRATWDGWGGATLRDLAAGDAGLEARLAAAIRFDLAAGGFRDDSPVIAGTNAEVAALLAAELTGRDPVRLERDLVRAAEAAPLVPAAPLAPLLDTLRGAGLRLGVMTNDSQSVAEAHLRRAGVRDRFDFVAGADSGHGAKPDPGPLLAFARAMGLKPRQVAMVGDSTHDLRAAQAAGMVPLGVLTGPALHADLAPLARAVLPDIGHLPDWLGL